MFGQCFPSIVAFRISFPFDEVLELSRPSMMLVAFDLLHFIFFFSINQIWWRLGKVRAICRGFAIGQ